MTTLAEDVYLHTFERQGGAQALTGLNVGERVVVGDQDSKFIAMDAAGGERQTQTDLQALSRCDGDTHAGPTDQRREGGERGQE